jgi:hypothetical protein
MTSQPAAASRRSLDSAGHRVQSSLASYDLKADHYIGGVGADLIGLVQGAESDFVGHAGNAARSW